MSNEIEQVQIRLISAAMAGVHTATAEMIQDLFNYPQRSEIECVAHDLVMQIDRLGSPKKEPE